MDDLKLPDSILKKADTIEVSPYSGSPIKDFWRELHAISDEDEQKEVAGRWALFTYYPS